MLNKIIVGALLLLLCGLGFIFGYEYFVAKPRDLALQEQVAEIKAQANDESAVRERLALQAATQESKQALENAKAASQELRGMSEQTQQQILLAQQQASEQRKQAEVDAFLSDAFAKAQAHKVAVVEHYQTNLQWPSSAEEIGVTDPSAFAGGAVSSISVEKNGVIRIRFNQQLANNASVFLIPTADKQTYQISWRCDAKELVGVKSSIKGCDF